MTEMASTGHADNAVPAHWTFSPRWRIRGCLICESPLFIGSGGFTHREGFDGRDGQIEISDCQRDARRRPVIPATSLKGVLRVCLQGRDEARIQRLFGDDSVRGDSGRGGEAEFQDATLTLERSGDTPLPHWDAGRQTWLEIINSIDRERGVAAENHLAYRETVAAGSGFEVVISGRFSAPDGDIPLLLAALEGLNDPENPVLLGADTGSGKGRMRWELTGIERMDATAALAWLNDPGRGMAADAFRALSPEEIREKLQAACRITGPAGDAEKLTLTLQIDGPFLVDNPPTERERSVPEEMKPPNARPRTDAQGRVILPAKSFRGVLRSRAERILRTLLDEEEQRWTSGGFQAFVRENVACRPELPAQACGPLKNAENREKELCMACQLFGAPGWRSPIGVSDFTLVPGNYESRIQEMVAVDRFTGGGREGAKYNALAIISPVLKGTISLDTRRAPEWGLGLLALVLRDLRDGELAFGWGAAGKGYGRCEQAHIDRWHEKEFRDKAEHAWEQLRETIERAKAKGTDHE